MKRKTLRSIKQQKGLGRGRHQRQLEEYHEPRVGKAFAKGWAVSFFPNDSRDMVEWMSSGKLIPYHGSIIGSTKAKLLCRLFSNLILIRQSLFCSVQKMSVQNLANSSQSIYLVPSCHLLRQSGTLVSGLIQIFPSLAMWGISARLVLFISGI